MQGLEQIRWVNVLPGNQKSIWAVLTQQWKINLENEIEATMLIYMGLDSVVLYEGHVGVDMGIPPK